MDKEGAEPVPLQAAPTIVTSFSLKCVQEAPSCGSGIPLEVLGDNFPINLMAPRGAKSHYWKYFGLRPNGMDVDKSKVYCKLCRSALAYHGSTTCLSQHLFHMHPNEYKECHEAKAVKSTPAFLPPKTTWNKPRTRIRARPKPISDTVSDDSSSDVTTQKETVDLTSILTDLCWMLRVPGHNWNESVSQRRQTPEDVVVSLVKSHQRCCELCISHREEENQRKEEVKKQRIDSDVLMFPEHIKKEMPDPEEYMEEEETSSSPPPIKQETNGYSHPEDEQGKNCCVICKRTFSETCVREADIYLDTLPDTGTKIIDRLLQMFPVSKKDPFCFSSSYICSFCLVDLRKMDSLENGLKKRHEKDKLSQVSDDKKEEKLDLLLNGQTTMIANQRALASQQKLMLQFLQSLVLK